MKIYMIIACLALTACGERTPRDEPAVSGEQGSVFDPMTDQIDKAKAVEDVALRHKQDIDDAVRAIEEPPDTPVNDQ